MRARHRCIVVLPLSSTQDSIGPIAPGVSCCALFIPCHEPVSAPVGLMLVGQSGEDRRLLAVGLALESALRA